MTKTESQNRNNRDESVQLVVPTNSATGICKCLHQEISFDDVWKKMYKYLRPSTSLAKINY